ncbi:MAG: CAP domain-containing protein [Myxococcota bacterium]
MSPTKMIKNSHYCLGALLLFGFATACDVETEPLADIHAEQGRGDSFRVVVPMPPGGSCQAEGGDFCGGPSSDGCWCDDLCVGYGDCCDDVYAVCGIGPDPDPEPEPEPDVPNIPYCDDASNWDANSASLEAQILDLTNQVRQAGRDCGSQGVFPPVPPLTADPALRCAARVHALDMDARNYFAHNSPEGETPWERMNNAGYSWSSAAENIAAGNATAQATVDQWLNSDGHCANIMSASNTELGVGYVAGGPYGTLWVQVFGSPL